MKPFFGLKANLNWDTKKSKHLKYRWPSDAPYVVTELTRQVIFDVDNNSVCDFNESKNTYEISRDKYY